ncbi:Glomulin [Eumeta japonica]|uniref:Glomulin n=1 Tax=Eumeta variegata TaxID=151549 RepID=A0A4C1U0N6_EUMVA|nr:Glomulin [Eumeta japonica]
MEDCVDVVEILSNLLVSGKYKEVLAIPYNEKYKQNFKDNCCDIISVIIGKLDNDTAVTKPSLQTTSEELLSIIVEIANPEEILLEFIEQIEVSKNEAQFLTLLSPIQQLLKRLTSKRGRSLEWCLNAISTYIETIPISNYNLEGKEQLLLDNDSNVRRLMKVYSNLSPFYAPFVDELNLNIVKKETTKEIIVAFLISLLGKPLIYIDLDPETGCKSEARACCQQILNDICSLEKNILKFLVYVEYHNENRKINSGESAAEISPYDQNEKINMTTLAGLFYSVLSGHFEIKHYAVPQVYSSEYIVQTVFRCVIHLLNFTEYGPLLKAVQLLKSLLSRLSYPVSDALLSSPVHFDLSKNLVTVAIYGNYETIRKECVSLIGCHINKFDFKGRCLIIKYIMDTANHSGMIAYVISLYKNSINEVFQSNSNFPECFLGPKFESMLKKICYLPHGAESDLMELADQIITSLNFLRYMILRDVDNITGIRECFTFIENNYLKDLRTGLNLSKAHYEVKLKDVEEKKDTEKNHIPISVNVGGNDLTNMPIEVKKEVLISALNAFHLMEGLIARLVECMNSNKQCV